MSRTVRGGKAVTFEYVRIETLGAATQYIPQPEGGAPTVFTATKVGQNLLDVRNPEHDFPQRIVYRRDGNALTATISGPGKDGQEHSLSFGYQSCTD